MDSGFTRDSFYNGIRGDKQKIRESYISTVSGFFVQATK